MLSYNNDMTKELGPKIDRFVDEYLVDLNGTQAAIRAGYSERTAAQQASRLLRKVKVQQAVAALQQELAEKRAWDIERLVDEAETNLYGSRESKQWGSANGALDFIGRATGLLSDKPRDPQVAITRVTVVLNHGPDSEGNPQIVEATEYRELPPRPELGEGAPDLDEATP